jgi:hypothetical protein
VSELDAVMEYKQRLEDRCVALSRPLHPYLPLDRLMILFRLILGGDGVGDAVEKSRDGRSRSSITQVTSVSKHFGKGSF